MKTINSIRKFKIGGFESGLGFSSEYYLSDILSETNDTELIYSLQDNLDALLDLQIDEFLEMSANRDSKNAANRIIVWRLQ